MPPATGGSTGDDAAPGTGSPPATGAAPLPTVELLADLPELTGDDVLALPVADGGEPPAWLTGPALFAPHPVDADVLRDALAFDRNKGSAGTVTVLPASGRPSRGVLAVGIGSGTVPDVRSYAAAAVRRAQGLAEAGVRRLVLALDSAAAPAGADEVRTAVEAVLLAGYRFRETSTPHPARLESVTVVATDAGDAAVAAAARAGEVTASSVAWARDLINTPSNTKNPAWMAAEAGERLAGLEHVTVSVLEPEELRAGGFGGVLAVGGGSATPPRVIIASYRPPAAGPGHPVLVGKGITFDTGGMNLKPTGGIETMKTDMAGAAAVVGAMRAIAELDLPFTVLGILSSAENMPSGTAFRPGDVLTAMNGKTLEITSTDAEGRLVLADALVYAARQGADEMIDLATLTGAKTIAIGLESVAVFSNDDAFAQRVVAAGTQAGELYWQLPLWSELKDQIKSEIADMLNTGGRPGGAITAALIMSEFTEGKPWVHLDIAGAAWTSKERAYCPKGPTGVGVRALVNYLEAKAAG
jgi:leucyl aminopeptidase